LSRGGWKWGGEFAANDPLYLKAVTAFFAAVVVCQIANVLICRARREPLYKIGFFSNWLVWLGILVEMTLLLLIVYWPVLQPFLGTAPLTLGELLLGVPFALFMLVLDGLRKYLLRKKVHWVEKYGEW
jgi:sodium/potassium-transporting ATPase subunit alpha